MQDGVNDMASSLSIKKHHFAFQFFLSGSVNLQLIMLNIVKEFVRCMLQ